MKTPPPATLRRLLLLSWLFLAIVACASAQVDSYSLDNNGYIAWQTAPANKVSAPGTTIATHTYSVSADWFNETVPGTPFAAAVKAGRDGFTDAGFGDNIYRVNTSEKNTPKYNQNYWHRADFLAPSWTSGKTYWLNFDGVNQQGDIYFNGQALGSLFGFQARGKYNVTSLIKPGDWNTVAVLTYKPNDTIFNAWSPGYMGAPGGWDWMPPIPGSDTGIVDHVYLTSSTGLVLADPWMRTINCSSSQATLQFSTDVKNTSGAAINATVTCTLSQGGNQVGSSFSKTVNIPAGGSTNVGMDSGSFSQLVINNPKLWWPNGYGAADLYSCSVQVANGSTVSDKQTFNFGIRKYSYVKDGSNDSNPLVILVNGQKIFVRGGNWGQTDYLLNTHDYTAYSYDIRVRLHKEMNMNMIRNWTGSTTEHEFYDACDRYGIMVWDDFWLVNSIFAAPKNVPGFKDNAWQKILRLRNHACIAVWCGANESVPYEGDSSDANAPKLNSTLTWYVYALDGNDRLYQSSSNSGNLSGSGSWSWQDPHYFFNGVARDNKSFGFRTELGTAVLPNYESVARFIPADHLWPANANNGKGLTNDPYWQYHFWGTWQDANNPNNSAADSNGYATAINNRYGTVTGIQDLCKKAQLANIEATKAMFEAWNDGMFTTSTGILTWMSQSAYPSMLWQTYDYYYDLTGAYWGAKKGCESMHIQWNPNTNDIKVLNTTPNALNGVKARVTFINKDGTTKSVQSSGSLNVPVNTVQTAFNLNVNVASLSDTHFLRLELLDSSNAVIADNSYWRGVNDGNFTGLNSMGSPSGLAASTPNAVNAFGVTVVTTTISNPSNSAAVAFAVRVQLVRNSDNARVLPATQSDNYFTLLKGESKQVTFICDPALLNGTSPKIIVSSYN